MHALALSHIATVRDNVDQIRVHIRELDFNLWTNLTEGQLEQGRINHDVIVNVLGNARKDSNVLLGDKWSSVVYVDQTSGHLYQAQQTMPIRCLESGTQLVTS